MSGGAVGFKIEGLIQLYEGSEVKFISPQTISANIKKNMPAIPDKLHKYQQVAFETAFAALA